MLKRCKYSPCSGRKEGTVTCFTRDQMLQGKPCQSLSRDFTCSASSPLVCQPILQPVVILQLDKAMPNKKITDSNGHNWKRKNSTNVSTLLEDWSLTTTENEKDIVEDEIKVKVPSEVESLPKRVDCDFDLYSHLDVLSKNVLSKPLADLSTVHEQREENTLSLVEVKTDEKCNSTSDVKKEDWNGMTLNKSNLEFDEFCQREYKNLILNSNSNLVEDFQNLSDDSLAEITVKEEIANPEIIKKDEDITYSEDQKTCLQKKENRKKKKSNKDFSNKPAVPLKDEYVALVNASLKILNELKKCDFSDSDSEGDIAYDSAEVEDYVYTPKINYEALNLLKKSLYDPNFSKRSWKFQKSREPNGKDTKNRKKISLKKRDNKSDHKVDLPSDAMGTGASSLFSSESRKVFPSRVKNNGKTIKSKSKNMKARKPVHRKRRRRKILKFTESDVKTRSPSPSTTRMERNEPEKEKPKIIPYEPLEDYHEGEISPDCYSLAVEKPSQCNILKRPNILSRSKSKSTDHCNTEKVDNSLLTHQTLYNLVTGTETLTTTVSLDERIRVLDDSSQGHSLENCSSSQSLPLNALDDISAKMKYSYFNPNFRHLRVGRVVLESDHCYLPYNPLEDEVERLIIAEAAVATQRNSQEEKPIPSVKPESEEKDQKYVNVAAPREEEVATSPTNPQTLNKSRSKKASKKNKNSVDEPSNAGKRNTSQIPTRLRRDVRHSFLHTQKERERRKELTNLFTQLYRAIGKDRGDETPCKATVLALSKDYILFLQGEERRLLNELKELKQKQRDELKHLNRLCQGFSFQRKNEAEGQTGIAQDENETGAYKSQRGRCLKKPRNFYTQFNLNAKI